MIFGSLWFGIVLTIDCGDCPLIAIGWTIDVWCFQSILIGQTNDPEDCLSTRIVLKIVFTGRLWIRIACKIDVWCFQVVGIVQTKDIGGCLLKRILMKVVFTGWLLISISWTIDFGWCTRMENVRTTAFGGGPITRIIWTIEFKSAPSFITASYSFRVHLIDLVSITLLLPL